MALKDHVLAMESRDSRTRGDYVVRALGHLGISPVFQTRAFPRVRNIIVDLPPGGEPRRVLFSAHYDAVKNTPAANDNASSVAVLLGLCDEMRAPPIPLRIIFFDREEAWLHTPLLKLGVLGSFFYVLRNKPGNVAAVYNLEFVGHGDLVGVWPVKGNQTALPVVRTIEQAARTLDVPVRLAHIPWLLMGSDHLPFRLRGVGNAVTLSLLPSDQAPVLEAFVSRLTVRGLLFRPRPLLPDPLSLVHTANDTSAHIDEASLQLALSLLKEIIREHASRARETIVLKRG